MFSTREVRLGLQLEKVQIPIFPFYNKPPEGCTLNFILRPPVVHYGSGTQTLLVVIVGGLEDFETKVVSTESDGYIGQPLRKQVAM